MVKIYTMFQSRGSLDSAKREAKHFKKTGTDAIITEELGQDQDKRYGVVVEARKYKKERLGMKPVGVRSHGRKGTAGVISHKRLRPKR